MHRKPQDPLFFPVGDITEYLCEGLPQHEYRGRKHQQAKCTFQLLFRQHGSHLAACEHTGRRNEGKPKG